jgi:prephenate dehydrogenase
MFSNLLRLWGVARGAGVWNNRTAGGARLETEAEAALNQVGSPSRLRAAKAMTNSPIWNRVTVVGCGLIGASFAMALRRSRLAGTIAGWGSSDATLKKAVESGVIDEVDQALARGEASSSDLVYLATPVCEIVNFLAERGPGMRPGTVVTDAGSTKAEICRTAQEHLSAEAIFIGGHPVAGSQHTGLAHARAELFEGQPYVLVGDGLELLRRTVEAFGARVRVMTAEEHDRALAMVSHLPQLLSSALRKTVGAKEGADALLDLSGAGYRDMTRLAASSWSIWRDILATNPAPIADALEEIIGNLEQARDELRESELKGLREWFD